MDKSEEIACPICRRANTSFEALNHQINQAKTPAEKAPAAKLLIEKAEAVLQEHAAPGNVLTDACRTLLNLRKQTAQLILGFQRR